MAYSLQKEKIKKKSLKQSALPQKEKFPSKVTWKMESLMETGPLFFLMDDQDGRVLKKRESATALSRCGIQMVKGKLKGIMKKEKSMAFPRCGTWTV